MRNLFRILIFWVTIVVNVHVAKTQWVQTNGPTGGSVNSFAVSGTNLFAGTAGGGIFRSTNSGANWTQVNTGLGTVWTLAASPAGQAAWFSLPELTALVSFA